MWLSHSTPTLGRINWGEAAIVDVQNTYKTVTAPDTDIICQSATFNLLIWRQGDNVGIAHPSRDYLVGVDEQRDEGDHFVASVNDKPHRVRNTTILGRPISTCS